MNRTLMLLFGLVAVNSLSFSTPLEKYSAGRFISIDSLPYVLPENHADLIESRLRFEAVMNFAQHQLPASINEWEAYRPQLRNEIIRKTGIVFNPKLPLNVKETGSSSMKGYTVKNIYFQTRPGIYTTANLYVPDGKGPFPAVINMLGHWQRGKIDSSGPQPVGHSLARNGYVCLTVDPWGSGERTTVHGKFEDHGDGNNLGTALINIGEPLIGIEISDNVRGIDLLCSLPYVDQKKIGATGASGGGNQTMWLAAIDERVKAAMPVVSVGTFGSYIMGTPCICEVMTDALTFTEEAGILAMVAPRAIKMCNHKRDSNPAFNPAEMLRSYNNARPIFKMLGVEDNISYQLFDLTHGYMAEDREAMLGWFDLHLKGIGNGSSKKEAPFNLLPEDKLMVFPKGQRDPVVKTTEEYCKLRGNELRTDLLNSKSFDINQKKKELQSILQTEEKVNLEEIHKFSSMGSWDRFALETSDNKLIPVLLISPSGSSKDFVIVCNPEGKEHISLELLDGIVKSGSGVAIVDLTGTGEASFTSPRINYDRGKLRVLTRSELWFGRTILGEWVKELSLVSQFLTSTYKADKINIDGSKETGLAALFLSVTNGKINSVTLRDAPVSYLFDNRESIDFYSSGIFLKGFLNWGDVSLAAALTGKNILFINPLTISGQKLSEARLKEYQSEFEKLRSICKLPGKTIFN
jgi:hypothetical protein